MEHSFAKAGKKWSRNGPLAPLKTVPKGDHFFHAFHSKWLNMGLHPKRIRLMFSVNPNRRPTGIILPTYKVPELITNRNVFFWYTGYFQSASKVILESVESGSEARYSSDPESEKKNLFLSTETYCSFPALSETFWMSRPISNTYSTRTVDLA